MTNSKVFNADIDKIRQEWHPTLNGDMHFDDLATGSGKEVWWLGSTCKHEWQTKMFARAVRGAECPICNNRLLLTGFNDIATVHPDWVAFWSPTNELPCDQVIAGGKPEHAWLCDKGHEFFSSVGHKELGRSCPYCLNKKVLVGFNDLASQEPAIAAQWHPTKNGELTPEDVVAGGASKYWWVDELGHEWDTTISRRISGYGCRICAGLEVLVGFNDLASQEPVISMEWHPTKNGELTPSLVFVRSSILAWWQCAKGHEWQTKILNRTAQGNSCKECKNGVQKPMTEAHSLFQAEPKLSEQWHPTLNGDFTPKDVMRGSNAKVWWLGECGHEWQAKISSRSIAGNGCLVCAGFKVLSGFNDLATTHPLISAQWHPTLNKEITAEMITAGSNDKYWWIDEFGHEWESAVYHRVDGRNCPVCSGHKVVKGINDFATVNPLLAAQWHPTKNGDMKPEDVTGKGGRSEAWWMCDKGHEWQAGVKERIRGRGCSQCWAKTYISKAEQELHDYVCSLDANMNVVQSNKKLLKGKELDIYVPEKKIAIEFNGLYWHSEKAGKEANYHYDKWLACKEAGVQLIQVWEDEWNSNPDQIKRMLAHKLGFSNQRKVFARKTKVISVSTAKAIAFLDVNHVQGYASGSHYLALVEKNDASEEILALLVLKKEGGTDGKVLNIIRYATSANVVGGFTKLLKYAEKTFTPESFITFADHCVSDGGLYENNGFVADKELAPDYMYLVDGERKHKFGYRLKRFKNDPNLLWEEGLTERELAVLNGLDRVVDAGKTRYRYTVKEII